MPVARIAKWQPTCEERQLGESANQRRYRATQRISFLRRVEWDCFVEAREHLFDQLNVVRLYRNYVEKL